MIKAFPLLICIAGLVMFLLGSARPTPNPATIRIGEIMFFCGLLALTLNPEKFLLY